MKQSYNYTAHHDHSLMPK